MSSVRASRYLIPTLKDDPADAEAVSHRMLVRGGFVRQVGSGLYTYLPLGWRVLQNVREIIRQEMDTIGVEMSMPVLNPAELWKTTGRYGIEALFKLEDSSGKPYVLALSHEECVTFHASREIRSYRDLPQIWYHIQTKERDEPRPKSGILRTREFIMKDSYSFDRDVRGAGRELPRAHPGLPADLRPLRAGDLDGRVGRRHDGRHRGPRVHGAQPGRRGHRRPLRDLRLRLERRDGAGDPAAPEFPPPLDAPEEIETPGITTIEGLAEMLGIDPAATAKAMVVVRDGDVVLALVRGDHRLHEMKLSKVLQGAIRPASREEITSTFGAEPGSIGAVGATVRVIADDALRDGPVRRRGQSHGLAPARRGGRKGLPGGVRGHPRGRAGRPLSRLL